MMDKDFTQFNLIFYCDFKRHLICEPYSIENLHYMAHILNIKKCWFHKNHYDIPKKELKKLKINV